MGKEASPDKVVQEIRRKTRRRFSAEEKIRIVLEGLRGEESIAPLLLGGRFGDQFREMVHDRRNRGLDSRLRLEILDHLPRAVVVL
jgi:transposase